MLLFTVTLLTDANSFGSLKLILRGILAEVTIIQILLSP